MRADPPQSAFHFDLHRPIGGDVGARRELSMTQSEDVIDMSVIAALRELGDDGDENLFRELLDLYLDDSTRQLKRLEEALANGDLKLAERIAHTLKSSSANLGAMMMSKVCQQMELCGRKQSAAEMNALLEPAREAHRRAVSALSALRT